MRITVAAVGRMKSGPERELLSRYLDRAARSGRHLGVSAVGIRETGESRKATAPLRMEEEAGALCTALGPGAFTILLDERGEDIDSTAFAALLRANLDAGVAETAFLIGGPDGHGDAARNIARRALRLGRMTWPHQLARIMLAEQVYRAVCILSGHPYHRE